MSPTLPTRKLGKNGPEVVALGYGAMGLSVFYGTPKPDEERLAVFDQLYEMGARFWDTANMYGDNEDLIGKWFKLHPERRSDIFLATKFANITVDGQPAVDSSPKYCKEACAKSLERLGVDYIDLYYCHRLDGKTPIEATVRAMAELKSEGKIRHIGLSECSATSLRRACKVHHIDAVQVEYSPFSLEIEDPKIDVARVARELGVAIVAYSPIGRGLLSGKYRTSSDFEENDFRRHMPRFSEENFPKNLVLVDKFVALAKEKGCTPTQLCLAWLMAQGDDVIPIPGSTNLERIKENYEALKVTLTDEEAREIRKACEDCEVGGDRYPEAFMKFNYADTPEE